MSRGSITVWFVQIRRPNRERTAMVNMYRCVKTKNTTAPAIDDVVDQTAANELMDLGVEVIIGPRKIGERMGDR